MRVLITRPIEDAKDLALRIERRGHACMIEPLLSISHFEGPALDLTNCSALIFTSANGARSAARRIADKSVPVIAIGPATAEAARHAGFEDIWHGNGEGVIELEREITSMTNLRKGSLLHISGETISGNLVENLNKAGLKATRVSLYRAEPASALSPALYDALIAGSIDAAMFFSPRTATTFSELVKAASCEQALSTISALALSQNVARSLATLTFRKLLVAQNQGTEAMLDLLAAV